MQKANLDFVIEQAEHADRKDKFGKAVAKSIEVGVVVPSILRTNLEVAGYSILEDKASLSDYGFASAKILQRVLVTDKEGTIIAMGAAGDHAEALLHAALGYFRENPVGDASPPQGIAIAPKNG